jgi:hypothetical protein
MTQGRANSAVWRLETRVAGAQHRFVGNVRESVALSVVHCLDVIELTTTFWQRLEGRHPGKSWLPAAPHCLLRGRRAERLFIRLAGHTGVMRKCDYNM